MGVKDSTTFLTAAAGRETTIKVIRQRVGDDSQAVVGIDVAIPMNKAMSHNKSVDQASAIPPMPVAHTANVVLEFFKLFIDAGFTTIAVFDGKTRYPPKAGTNERRYGNKEEEVAKLEAMYKDLDTVYTIDQIRAQQKKALKIDEFIFHVVADKLAKEGIRIICAPFEADSQLVSLYKQGIIDYAVTEDSDIPFQGAKTIRKVTKKGKCHLVSYEQLERQLAKAFKTQHDHVTIYETSIFAALLGNDYVDRLPGKGKKASVDFMIKYFATEDAEQKAKMLCNYVNCLEKAEQKKAFWIALESWQHAPALIIMSNDPEKTARTAFFSSPSEESGFRVSLGPMSCSNHQGVTENFTEEDFWLYEDMNDNQPGRATMKLGFIPSNEFKEADEHKLLEYFNLEVWCRTDRPLPERELGTNINGDTVWPGAILDFDKRPIHTYPDWMLTTWLVAARDIQCDEYDRAKLIDQVSKGSKQDPPLFILPQFILKGAGGYTSFAV